MTVSDKHKFDQIRAWLNGGRNYQQGLMLLMSYSDLKATVESLRIYQNEHLMLKTIRDMYDALKKALTVDPAPGAKKIVAAEEIKNTEAKKPLPSSSDLKKIAEIKAAITKLYKERAMYHNQMCDIGEKADHRALEKLTDAEINDRHQLAKLIMERDDKIKHFWAIVDDYEESGILTLPEGEAITAPKILSKSDALKRLKNSVAPNVSKLTKKIRKAGEQLADLHGIQIPSGTAKDFKENLTYQLEEWKPKLAALEAEKRELETLINE